MGVFQNNKHSKYNFIIPLLFFLLLSSLFLTSQLSFAVEQPTLSLGVSQLDLKDNKLSVDAKDAYVKDLLKSISAKSGIDIEVDESITDKITIKFEGLSLEEGIQKIAGNWVIAFAKDDKDNFVIKKVSVFVKKNGGGSARSDEQNKQPPVQEAKRRDISASKPSSNISKVQDSSKLEARTYKNLSTGREIKYVSDQLLLRFKKDVPQKEIDSFIKDRGASVIKSIKKLNYYILKLADGEDPLVVSENFKKHNIIEVSEPNYIARIMAVPNDTYYPKQWALQKIGAEKAWDITTGRPDVIVAVIDTGVELTHPDLKANLIAGYDFANDDKDPSDDNGHGTAVAGIIGAVGNNKEGVSGVSWNSSLMPLKVISASGEGTYSDTAEAIIYAADNKARVINLSLGGYGYSQLLNDAVDYAYSSNCVLIAAAGNEGTDEPLYPAAYPNVIGVAATDQSDKAWSLSNHGDYIKLSAPGVDIFSTNEEQSYGSFNGTSLSSAIVSGTAALTLSKNINLSNVQVAEILSDSSMDLGEKGYDDIYGSGRLDIEKAMTAASIEVHDVAIIQAIIEPAVINVGEQAYIVLTVKNLGNFIEKNLNVNISQNGKPLGEEKKIAQLNPNESITFKTEWIPDTSSQGAFYKILCQVSQVESEQNISNNSRTIRSNILIEDNKVSIKYSIGPLDNSPMHELLAYEAYNKFKDVNFSQEMKTEFDKFLKKNGTDYKHKYTDYDDSDNLKDGAHPEIGNYLLEGAQEEDLYNPVDGTGYYSGTYVINSGPDWWHADIFYNHFWEVDKNGDDTGYDNHKNAGHKALKYWKDYVVKYYKNNEPDFAYYYLGRMVHLLADMSVPAHTHNDGHNSSETLVGDDSYEEYFKNSSDNIQNYIESLTNQTIADYKNRLSAPGTDAYKKDERYLKNLFYELAQYSQYFDSDDVSGNNTDINGNNLDGSFSFEISSQNGSKRWAGYIKLKNVGFKSETVTLYKGSYDKTGIKLNLGSDYATSPSRCKILFSSSIINQMKEGYFFRVEYKSQLDSPKSEDIYEVQITHNWGDISDSDVKENYHKVIPKAISHIGALYKLFWDTTHIIPYFSAPSEGSTISSQYTLTASTTGIADSVKFYYRNPSNGNYDFIGNGTNDGTNNWSTKFDTKSYGLGLTNKQQIWLKVKGENAEGFSDEKEIYVYVDNTTTSSHVPVLKVSPENISVTATYNMENPDPQFISITNDGAGSLSWTATKDQSWIILSKASGTAPYTLQVDIDASGQSIGTHNGNITIKEIGANGSSKPIPVTLIVGKDNTTSDTIINTKGDAWVTAGGTTQNHGTDTTLKVGEYRDCIAFIQFDDLNKKIAGKSILKAELKVYLKTFVVSNISSSSTIEIEARSADQGWKEDTITYDNKPSTHSICNKPLSSSDEGAWISFDVTSKMEDWKQYSYDCGIALQQYNLNANYVLFSSEEGSYAPYLQIQFCDGNPDLKPDSPSLNTDNNSAPPFYEGQNAKWKTRINNIGAGCADDNKIAFYIGNDSADFSKKLGEKGLIILGTGKATSKSYDYTFIKEDIGKTKYFIAKVDSVSESHEARDNNVSYYGPFEVKALASIKADQQNVSFSAAEGSKNPGSQYLTVTVTGDDSIHWTASTTGNSPSPWLTIKPQESTGSGSIQMTVDITGLTQQGSPYNDTVNISATVNGSPAQISVTVTLNITQETSKPSGYVSLNDNDEYTNSSSVKVKLSAYDNIGITGYFISNASSVPSLDNPGWNTVTSSKSFNDTISNYSLSGDGTTKNVYVWFRDLAGNISDTCTDSIKIDNVAPAINISSPKSGYESSKTPITISGTASDSGGSGLKSISINTGASNTGSLSNWTFSADLQEDSNNITVTAEDIAGNVSTATISVSFIPSGPRIINKSPASGEAEVDISRNVEITFSEDMNASTITKLNLFIAGVESAVTYTSSTRVAVINPNKDFSYDTSYSVNVTSGVKSAKSEQFSGSVWTFTTAVNPCKALITISPDSQAFKYKKETGTIVVTATYGCDWSVVSDAEWITISLDNKAGSGNGNINYEVVTNTNTTGRTGHINVEGKVVTITQKGYSVSDDAGAINVTNNIDKASFTIDGPDGPFTGKGTSWSVSDVTVGDYTITYNKVSGYTKPSPQTKTLTKSGSLGEWSITKNITSHYLYGHAAVAYNSYIFVLGGYSNDGKYNNEISTATVNADGTLGDWTSLSDSVLPYAPQAHAAVMNDGYIFVLGGTYGGASTCDYVYSAKVNTSNIIEGWNPTTSLPKGVRNHVVIVNDGYIFLIGGYSDGTQNDTAVYSAPIYSNGTIGDWTNKNIPPLPKPLSSHAAVVSNGYVFVIGGESDSYQSKVYSAKINNNGTLGDWDTVNIPSLPSPLTAHKAVANNGYIFVMGGWTGSMYNKNVFAAKVNLDGTLSEWKTLTSEFPSGFANAAVVESNGYIFKLGGYAGEYDYNNYSAPISGIINFNGNYIYKTETFTINATVGEGGSISPSGDTIIEKGESQEYAISPLTGYKIKEVRVGGNPVQLTNNKYTFNDVSANYSIDASFESIQNIITATAGTGGSISPLGEISVDYGNDLEFTINTLEGYHVKEVKVDGGPVELIDNKYTVSYVTAPHTIDAIFEIDKHIIKATAGVGGSISPSGEIPIDYGNNKEFTITSLEGYHVKEVKVDGGPVELANNKYTFNYVTLEHTIDAVFEKNTDERPDLQILNISFNNSTCMGSFENISITVLNDKTNCVADAASFDVTVYLSKDNKKDLTDYTLKVFHVTALSAGSSKFLSDQAIIPSGEYHYLIVFADSGSAIIECDEDNNLEVIPLTISNPQLEHFTIPTTSGSFVTFWGDLRSYSSDYAEIGDEMAVFDEKNPLLLLGAGTVCSEGKYSVKVYGDNPSTLSVDEGAEQGDMLSFVYWDKSENNEYCLDSGETTTKWTSANDVWNVDMEALADIINPDFDHEVITETMTVNFWDNSVPEHDSCLWDFGDYSEPSEDMNPSHEYASHGVYTVTMTAFNDCGGATIEKQLIVGGCERPQISSIDKTQGYAYEEVVISGQCFGSEQGKVYFTKSGKSSECNVLNWTDTEISIEVPWLKYGNYNVSVEDESGNPSVETIKYYIKKSLSKITTVPSKAKQGQVVSISGQNFGRDEDADSKRSLYLGGKKIVWKSWNNDVITFKVPTGTSIGKKDIYIKTIYGTSNSKKINILKKK
ncbi:MAG: S8 family serine peptidase [Candidatus Schekmanbacteria bacterium]|nr:S8 family serine peptidase [Candidatus Schekmanbacteria bacterium]